MTRALAGMYLTIAVAFLAVNIYLAGTLTTGDVFGFVGIS